MNKKCTEMQTRNMIREAATSTDVRKNKIMEMLMKIDHNSSQVIKKFGIGVGKEFSEIPARILDAPNLMYENGTAIVKNGQWRGENYHFLNPRKLVNWVLLIVDPRTQINHVHDFARMVSFIIKLIQI